MAELGYLLLSQSGYCIQYCEPSKENLAPVSFNLELLGGDHGEPGQGRCSKNQCDLALTNHLLDKVA